MDDILTRVFVNTRLRAIVAAKIIGLVLLLGLSSGGAPIHAPKEALQRWQDAKLGLMIHFGPWSTTEQGTIWAIAKTHSVSEREKFLSLGTTFDPVHFDAGQYADLAKQAGMRYVVFTTKHHDGFCNFETALAHYKVTNPHFPCGRLPHPDLTRDVVQAFRARGLRVGLYYSHLDWHHPDGAWHHDGIFDDRFLPDHPDRWRRFVDFETGQVRELLTQYGPIDIFWFDIFWPPSGLPDAAPMLRMMRKLQPDMLINNRGTGDFGDFITPEQAVPEKPYDQPWESCITISDGSGFWYKGPQAKYKSTAELIYLLADAASKGGNLLLNVGPRGDGTLPEQERDRLLGMGQWLARNGQAIYATAASPLPAEPKWGRVTRRGSRLYLMVFDWPKAGMPLTVDVSASDVSSATLLTTGARLNYRASAHGRGIEIDLPAQAPDPIASVIVLDQATRISPK